LIETARPSGRLMRIVAWVLLGLAPCLLGGAVLARRSETAFRARAAEADGEVVAMRRVESRDRDGRLSVTWRPVFRFVAQDGATHQVESGTSSSPPAYRVGEAVRLRYDPARPERAAIIGDWGSWLWVAVPGILGAGFGAFGVLGLLQARRSDRVAARGAWHELPIAGVRHYVTADEDRLPRWVVQARWMDAAGRPHLFESEPLEFDPVPWLGSARTVRVFFDPAQPRADHAMDLGFLRRQA